MTFYEALYEFEQRYLNALAVESKRVIDIFDQQWQTISNEFNCYTQAYVEGDFVAAREHIDKILTELPALKRPTISKLAGSNGWYAVNTIIKKEEFLNLVPKLRKYAQGLVVHEPRQILPLEEIK